MSAVLIPPALAHAALVRSSPARRASLTRAPSRVELWFNEPLEAAYCSVSVWTAEGRQVDSRDVAVSARDPKQLSVGLPPLAPGGYTVRFRVLSVDGHVVESTFPFAIRATPAR
ncbi:MAG: copper resistance protein CopC [Candidatus Rokubacteria bacterium]|nr:copper resistance protein CopC [Candidatus Rokubacteria bacterium]